MNADPWLASFSAPLPPVNIELEAGVLGAILVRASCYEEAADEKLEAHHFADPGHRKVYEAIGQVVAGATGNSIAVDVAHALSRHAGLFENEGGPKRYVAQLAAGAISLMDTRYQARNIVDLWKRRQVMAAFQEAIADAATVDLDRPASLVAEQAMQAIDDAMGNGRGGGNGPIHISEAIQQALDSSERARQSGTHVTGVATGYRDLDDMMGGMDPGGLYVLAGATSMGKSALAWGIAENAAVAGIPVLFITMEMSSQSLGRRALARRTGIGTTQLRRGKYGPLDAPALVDAQAALSNLPLWMEHRPGITPAEVKLVAQSAKRRHGIGLVVVDHIGIMSSGGRHSNRTAEITAITGALKGTAMSLELPVLALSQLSRNVSSRDDHRPQLQDLRDSGSIEQDADAVLLLYRHHYYLSREKPVAKANEEPSSHSARLMKWQAECDACEHLGEVIAGKLRDGEIGSVRLFWDGRRTMFGDLDHHHGAGEAPF